MDGSQPQGMRPGEEAFTLVLSIRDNWNMQNSGHRVSARTEGEGQGKNELSNVKMHG
jgi:hypothetical protein